MGRILPTLNFKMSVPDVVISRKTYFLVTYVYQTKS